MLSRFVEEGSKIELRALQRGVEEGERRGGRREERRKIRS